MPTNTSDLLAGLRQLSSYDALVALAVDGLGFQFAGEPRSTVAWPVALRDAIRDIRVVARHGEFLVTYVEVADGALPRLLSVERQVTSRVLQAEPHTLLVFAGEANRLWHFVHVRYDPQVERRRQLRRFVVDLRDARRAERLRTTAERLAALSIPAGQQLTAPQVQERCDEAFRVSEISKGFLKEFTKVIGDLTKAILVANPRLLVDERAALQQAQLLMDRLVFLYFIQRKGWLNGEDDYLYSRFQRTYEAGHDSDSFYRERLLPLFHALSHRDWERPRLDSGEEEALPFLNGGLFDLPLEYGTARPPTDELIRVPNQTLHPVFQDFLEKYNFTVAEDSPLDVEVAVNPEVIGTIFETFVLTAENEPDTNAPDRRKATGSYYTPRVVVHFICRAVLRRYLAERTGIDEQVVKQLIEGDPAEQLDDDGMARLEALVTGEQARELRRWAMAVKACDPAVGSGAFLVGLLQEIVKLVRLLDLRAGGRPAIARRNHSYELKREIIENCLYGVDIQEQAARICELRLWLSLVVDYQWDESVADLRQRVEGVDPLPNLTFKVRVGDALLDQLFGRDWDVTARRHDELTTRIREVKRSYYGSRSPEGKRDLERQVLELELEQLEHRLNDQRLTIGATMPLSAALLSAAERKKYEATKGKLAELDAVLVRLTGAKRDLAAARTASAEDSRRFDATRKRLGVSFVWALDFAEVFDPERPAGVDQPSGFDIIVGNPPFVTARSPEKNKRYRARWSDSCHGKYELVAPFIELAGNKLLRNDGQLGYIASNAFGTREFGKPLVEGVIGKLGLRNVIDCSGLMFPGHGTPTLILLANPENRPASDPVQLCGTRLGKGQLREEAEETQLWRELEEGWDKEYVGEHVHSEAMPSAILARHPWTLDPGRLHIRLEVERHSARFSSLLGRGLTVGAMTNSDVVFTGPTSSMRRAVQGNDCLVWFYAGDESRDWTSIHGDSLVLLPYSPNGDLKAPSDMSKPTTEYLGRFKKHLLARTGMFFSAAKQRGEPFYRYEWFGYVPHEGKTLTSPEISTHFHAVPATGGIPKDTLRCFEPASEPLVLSVANSSVALSWLRQVCFCKRYSENPETGDYYEFAGGKVEQLPVPDTLVHDTATRRRASRFAERCAALGAEVPGFHPRKLFERPGEAYTDWYRGIRGYQQPHPHLKQEWLTAEQLQAAWKAALEAALARRREMVALQEEMDWLVYAAYGFLPEDDPAVNLNGPDGPRPIDQLDRPYRLIQYGSAIPSGWPEPHQALWRARLAAIEANAHIGQIEHPAYKRRWVEPFAPADFLDAYEWWLREKAEWLLEHELAGGAVNLEVWASRLRDDRSVLAAYEAAIAIDRREEKPRYNSRHSFSEHLRRTIDEETVPDDRSAFRARHVKLRRIDEKRHLANGVPRERFRSQTARPSWYVWAGKDLWGGVQGDRWDV